MRKLSVTGAVVFSTGLLLSACSEPSEGSSSTASDAGGEEQVTITVYTSEPEEKVDEINSAFEAENPNIQVEVFRAGTGDLTARIDAEKSTGDIGADIFWAADSPTFEKYKGSGDLAELNGVDTSSVIEAARDSDGFYVGTRLIPTVIAYNTEVLGQDDIPASWQDLTDPKFADRIVLPDPAVSGAAAFNATAWATNDQLGQEWISALGANRPMVAASNGPTSQEIASGGRPVGIVVDYLARDLAASGSPIATVYPSEGAPFITEPIAIFEDSAAKEAAKKYVEFILSEAGQKIAVKQNYLPVIESVGTPGDTPSVSDIPLMDTDLQTLTDERAGAVAAFQDAMS